MLRASIIYLVSRALAAVLSLGSIAVFSRILAPAEFGTYSLALTSAGLFNAMFCTWVIQSMFRSFSEHHDPVRLQSTGLFALLGCGLLSAAVATVILMVTATPILPLLVAGLVLLFTGWSFFEYLIVQFSMHQRPRLYLELQIWKLFCCFALPTASWFAWERFDLFMLALGLAHWAPCIFPRFLFWAKGIRPDLFDAALVRELARYGLPLGLALLLTFAGLSAERFVLGMSAGVDTVAGYAIGADLALFTLGMMASALNQAFYPALLQRHASGDAAATEALFGSYCVNFFALMLPAAAGLFVLAPDIATLIAGPVVRDDAAEVLRYFAVIALLFNIKTHIIDLTFQISRRVMTAAAISLTGLAALLVVAWLVIPTLGIAGAAVASFAGAATGGFVAFWLASRAGQLPRLPIAECGKIVLAASVMISGIYAASGWLSGWHRLVMLPILGVSLYLVCLWLLKFQDIRELGSRLLFRRRAI